MSEWERTCIGDLIDAGEAELQTGPFGTQLSAGEYVEHGIPLINVRNIGVGTLVTAKLEYISEQTAHRLSVHRLKEKDLVFCRKGAVERHLLVPQTADGWIQGSDCMRLRVNSDRVYAPLRSYYFSTAGHQAWMEAQCSFGATMSSLNQGVIRRIKMLLPPLPIQRKIAAILSAYDDLIENNTRRIALLEKMAEEVYREWFVRLRFPGYEKRELVRSDLGFIPKSWRVGKVKNVVKLQSGFAFTSMAFTDSGKFGLVTIRNVHDGKFVSDCDSRLVETPINMPSHCNIRDGDILMSLTGNVGRVCLAYGRHLLLNQRVAKLEPLNLRNRAFIYCLFRSEAFRLGLETITNGVAQQNLSPIYASELPAVLPDEKVLQQFSKIMGSALELMIGLWRTNSKLQKTRDLLLSRLLSGKLDVEHRDIRFPPGMDEGDENITKDRNTLKNGT